MARADLAGALVAAVCRAAAAEIARMRRRENEGAAQGLHHAHDEGQYQAVDRAKSGKADWDFVDMTIDSACIHREIRDWPIRKTDFPRLVNFVYDNTLSLKNKHGSGRTERISGIGLFCSVEASCIGGHPALSCRQ